MPPQDALDKVIGFLSSLASEAASTLGDAESRTALMLSAGLTPSAALGTADTSAAIQQLETVRANAASGGGDSGTDALQRLEDLGEALMALVSLVELVAEIHDTESSLEAAAALLDVVAVGRLRARQPTWLAVLSALHLVVEDRLLIADAIRAHDQWGTFLLGDPSGDDEAVESWSLILAAGLAVLGAFVPPEDDAGKTWRLDTLFGWDPDTSPAQPNAQRLLGRMATLRWTQRVVGGPAQPNVELGATLAVVPPADGGWGIFFALDLGDGLTIPIGEHLELLLAADAPAAFAAVLGNETKLLPGGAGTSAKIELRRKQETAEHWVIGPEKKVHLEIGTFSTGFQLGPEGGFRLKIGDGALKLPQESMGPLKSGLPSDGATLTFDVDLLVDGNGKVTFVGGAGLAVTVPVNKKLAFLDVRSVTVAVQLKDGDKGAAASLEVTTAFSLVFGTVLTFVVDGIGGELAWTLPASPRPAPGALPTPASGSLGPYGDLSLDFVAPKGIGVALNAGPVKGGGFLFFDPDHGTYGGVLEATLGLCSKGISLKAAGVLRETPSGWSLVVIVSAEFDPPIEIFLGLALSGVGGLVGINVSLDVDKLRQGLHDGAVGNLLFPKDPVANAPAIIETLSTMFPPRPGGWVAGPMLQLSWGRPNKFAKLSFALVLAMPEPPLIVILGRLSVAAPTENLGIVSINVDFLGVIDLEQPSVSIDASLVDSRIAAFSLTGDMAMRAGPQGFLISFGGFHPRFNPPMPVPKLRRLALDISANPVTKIRCEAYLAVTSNTFQTGFHAELDVSAGPASLHGWADFDALVQWDPKFWFSVQISAGLELRVSGHCLAGISVELLLEGPGPRRRHRAHPLLLDHRPLRDDLGRRRSRPADPDGGRLRHRCSGPRSARSLVRCCTRRRPGGDLPHS